MTERSVDGNKLNDTTSRNYGSTTPPRSLSPTRTPEEAGLQREFREYVESRKFQNITMLLKKKRALALELMEREIKRLKSSPPAPRRYESELVESVQSITLAEIAEEEDEEETQRAVNRWRVSFHVERTSRLLIYAKQEWKHAQQLAVDSQVARLIIQTMTPKHIALTTSKKEIPKKMVVNEAVDLHLVELIYEFIAGGYEPAQNALYRAMLEVYDDDNDETTADVDRKELFVRFLLKYIRKENQPPEANKFSTHYQKTALAVVQLLCENHNSKWQAMMLEPYDGCTILSAIVDIMGDIEYTDSMFSKCMRCLSEACQGPCPANQDFIVKSKAAEYCCNVLIYEKLETSIYQTASEVLLSLMEGRTDSDVNASLARLFPASEVVGRLVECHRGLVHIYGNELSFEENDIHRHPFYIKAMSLMVVAVRIMSLEASQDFMFDSPLDENDEEIDEVYRNVTNSIDDDPEAVELELRNRIKRTVRGLMKQSKSGSDALTLQAAIRKVINMNRALKQFDLRSVQGFRTQWENGIDERKAIVPIRFFHSQLISIEIVLHGILTTIYFIKPHDAMYFDENLQNELVDEMDIGSEKALDVLNSETAKRIEEELKVIKYLKRNKIYKFLSKYEKNIRKRLLCLCFYINFIMLLLLKYENTIDSYNLLKIIGFFYFIGILILFFFYIIKEYYLNFNKQQLNITKLYFRTSKSINNKIWDVTSHLRHLLEFFIFTVTLIIIINGWQSYGAYTCCSIASIILLLEILHVIREIATILRFSVDCESSYTKMKLKLGLRPWKSKFLFWYSIFYDTLFSKNILAFLFYFLCSFISLFNGINTPYLLYGFPLLDLVATHSSLRFVILAMSENRSKLAITAIFGVVVIYIFSLIGFYYFQNEMNSENEKNCHSLMHCFMTFLHSGLLEGGGIGEYMNDKIELNYKIKSNYFGRIFFNLFFYILVIVLLLNLIQGIIIDSFTSIRETSENKIILKRKQCLICNRSRYIIENDGMNNGIMNSFLKHIEIKHNLFYYFFFIKYLKNKDEIDMNGMETYIFNKIKNKDMTWIPQV